MTLHLVPIRFRDAAAFVAMWHRHHQPPVGMVFAVGAADNDGVLHGVAIAGRPVARLLDNGQTLEVTRVATDGARNTCSLLYGASRRAAFALGYTRLITYTQAGETGASLRASGWRVVAERPAHPGWDRPNRSRRPTGTEGIPRTLWEADEPDTA
ncbi:MAG TPA: XF1762 family protein [Streptomyces sp.]